jgi:hypothetical protein
MFICNKISIQNDNDNQIEVKSLFTSKINPNNKMSYQRQLISSKFN